MANISCSLNDMSTSSMLLTSMNLGTLSPISFNILRFSDFKTHPPSCKLDFSKN